MAADPTEEERRNMTDLKAVLQWAGFDVTNPDEETSVAGSLLKHLGVNSGMMPRVVGIFSETDLAAVQNTWKVADAGAHRLPSLGEAGMAKLFFRACQLVAGTGESLEDLKNKAVANVGAPTNPPQKAATSPTKKVKLSSVISQTDDTELTVAGEKEVLQWYARYEAVFGQGERPAKDYEPAAEQLTGLQHLCSQGSPPYADFSIFGPFGHRMMKRIKLSGYSIERDGTLRTVEMYGPNNLGAWLQSYNVLMTVLVMLDAVDLGHLQKYRSHIERLAERYGQRVWSVIYQGDVRCRLEHMERLKRNLKAEHDRVLRAGGTSDFDESRPWNQVWAKATQDETFWREEVIEPCMLIITRISSTNEMVDGDAKVGAAASGSNPRDTTPTPAKMAASNDKQPVHPRNSNRTGRIHNTENGKYTHNRTGYSICSGFNSGQCAESTQGVWCRHNWDTVHQCDRCLGNHPSTKCPHAELQTPTFIKNAKGGKGRGKKGRGGGKGKRPPY